VGHYRKPPRYLQDGDTVAVEIDGIGALVNVCRTEDPTNDAGAE
jgi:2-keto-4-pentenoate hydratase/2-oxohepta-3-ene-1,7-dioic acid hydratase in catechol pathway